MYRHHFSESACLTQQPMQMGRAVTAVVRPLTILVGSISCLGVLAETQMACVTGANNAV